MRIRHFRLRGAVGAATALFGAAALAQQFSVSSLPLNILAQPGPNIVVTLDDSGSMARAYVPDEIGTLAGTRRFASSDFNPIYYNPAITYPRPVDANGQPLLANEPSLFGNAPVNGFALTQGRRNLSTSYRVSRTMVPGSSDNLAPNPAADYNVGGNDRTNTGVPAYYYVFRTGLPNCDGTRGDDDCYARVEVSGTSGPGGTDERENFANWYSFYRTRNLATVSAASLAFSNVDAPVRLAWQGLSTCSSFSGSNCSGWDGVNRDNRIRTFTGSHKQNFYEWLFRLPASSFTPLHAAMRRAGEYYRTSGDNSPYGLNPNQSPTVTGTQHACRANYHILMTDGLWNQSRADCGSNACGNQDGSNWTFPDGTAYSPRAPYTDANGSNSDWSLADLAFFYWRTDLSSLANQVKPFIRVRDADATAQYFNPRNNPATWQHMVNFTVGLGLSQFLDAPTFGGSTFAPQFSRFESGAAAWPLVGADAGDDGGENGRARVYDLWHAAVNSRGEFFSADSPRQLADAIGGAVQSVFNRLGSGAPLTTNSTRLQAGALVYQARFNASDWTGELRAFEVASNLTLGSQRWSTRDNASLIPAANARVILTWTGSAAIPFRYDDLDTLNLWPLMGLDGASAGERQAIVDYLRGDQSRETTAVNGIYRDRSTRVGDIVNSAPAFSGGQNFGYARLPEGNANGDAYVDYLAAKRSRTRMLFVGANDGMLHGFNADTGAMMFSYMPRAVLPNVRLLAQTNYAHRFYVDGSPVIGDAFFSGNAAGNRWRTILVGTTGLGGRAVFAIDVTDPAVLANEATAPTAVLWEISNANADFADLGLTVPQPIIARLNNGQWGAVIANGYNNSTNCPVLFVVDLRTGALMRRIDTLGSGPSTPCTSVPAGNGLSSPTLYDANNDGVVDYVYAGDLAGNLWKFDLSGNSPTTWKVDYASGGSPAPLFTARGPSDNVQPITVAPELGAAPPTAPAGSLMVYFGTGRYVASTDPTDTAVQSVYGIIDTGSRFTGTNHRSSLTQQTYTESMVDFAGTAGPEDDVPVRTVSNNTPTSSSRGWYIDFTNPANSGERVVTMPVLRSGRLFVQTLLPQDDLCATAGAGWVMAVNPFSGARFGSAVFDINRDNVINSADNYSGFRIGAATGLTFLTGVSSNRLLTSPVSGDEPTSRLTVADDIARGRISWRQIFR